MRSGQSIRIRVELSPGLSALTPRSRLAGPFSVLQPKDRQAYDE
jgi:hypothetical protein